jgi:hypothetical protein
LAFKKLDDANANSRDGVEANRGAL